MTAILKETKTRLKILEEKYKSQQKNQMTFQN